MIDAPAVETPKTPATPAAPAVVTPKPAQQARRAPDREAVRQNLLADLEADGIIGNNPEPTAEEEFFGPDEEGGDETVIEDGPAWDSAVNRFRAIDGTFTEAPADATPEQKKLEAEAIAKEAPAADKPKPVTEFKLTNSKGEAVAEVPDIQITYKADGKELTEPLDKVVKHAQQGRYNERLQQEVTEYRSEKPQLVQHIQHRDQIIQGMSQAWERVLKGDLQYLQAEMIAYEQAQSPEARAQRVEEENRRLREQNASQNQISQVQPVLSDIAGKVGALGDKFTEVTPEEILGQFQILTAPLLVNGRIPPQRLQEVVRLIESELTPFVESRHTDRAEKKKTASVNTADGERAKKVAAEQTRRAAEAKRQVSRAVMPSRQGHTAGTPSTGTPATQKKVYKSADDVRADIRNVARDFAREHAAT